jgi:hypothetical protein
MKDERKKVKNWYLAPPGLRYSRDEAPVVIEYPGESSEEASKGEKEGRGALYCV